MFLSFLFLSIMFLLRVFGLIVAFILCSMEASSTDNDINWDVRPPLAGSFSALGVLVIGGVVAVVLVYCLKRHGYRRHRARLYAKHYEYRRLENHKSRLSRHESVRTGHTLTSMKNIRTVYMVNSPPRPLAETRLVRVTKMNPVYRNREEERVLPLYVTKDTVLPMNVITDNNVPRSTAQFTHLPWYEIADHSHFKPVNSDTRLPRYVITDNDRSKSLTDLRYVNTDHRRSHNIHRRALSMIKDFRLPRYVITEDAHTHNVTTASRLPRYALTHTLLPRYTSTDNVRQITSDVSSTISNTVESH